MSQGAKRLASVAIVGTVLAAVLVAAAVAPNIGRDRGFTIDRFTRTVALEPGGQLVVTERIDVTFEQPRRGIFRDLELDGPAGPVTYHLEGVDRGDPSAPWTHVMERTDTGEPRVRIGDAAITLAPGPQTYRLRYRIDGLAFRPEARPEQVQLRLDVPGDAWPTDVAATELIVELPAAPTSVGCVVGGRGATGACPEPVISGATVTQRLDPLSPRTTGTVAVEVPVAAVGGAAGLPVRPVRDLDRRELLAPLDVPALPAALLLVGLMALPAALLETVRSRRVYRDEVTDEALHGRLAPTAELEPPDGLAPVELAALLRRTTDNTQLLATLIDLEIRGVVTTTSGEGGKPLVVGPGPRSRDARPWEAAAMEALCPGGASLTYDGEYDAETSKRSTAATSALRRHARGILGFRSRYTHERGGALRGAGYPLAILLVAVVAGLGGALTARLLGLGPAVVTVAGVALALAWIALALVWRHERLPLTSEGRDAIARARAFRTFLAEVHADRLEFAAGRSDVGTTHPAVALLPYAVSLGLADSWHERFEPLMTEAARSGRAGGTGSADTWYLHQGAYVGALAAHQSSITAPSSSSSGGSFGGGGAGSGGGGGGGGSW